MSAGFEQTARTPDTFHSAQLLAKDFDGTVALTTEKSPGGIGVHEAYELAIEDMFGPLSLDRYIGNGGLHNRAPLEVVQDLAPDATGDELAQMTAQFIGKKLAVLLGEIGSRFPDGSIWPRPTPGYFELREQVEAARSEGQLIDDLIISSGHEPFIDKTYKVWSVGEPTHVIGEDTIGRLSLALPTEQLVKPSPVLMDVAHNMWRQGYGLESAIDLPLDERSRIVYVGDDPVKDGELARRSGVEFVLLDPGSSAEIWRSVALRLQLGQTVLNGDAA